ncbi:MAG TPA: hypothetical protein VMU95_27570 [Trebonia sp.]|nr:hypothetical protein [Trebonia sp.]
MRGSVRPLSLLVAILIAACLTAGCSSITSTVKSVVSSAASNLPTHSAGPTPTSAAPTTAAPTTAAPTTAAASAPPTTQAAAAPAAPTTATATPAAGSGTSLIWLWILLGALVVAGLIAWITHMARRGHAAAADWRSRVVDAYAKGSALHDAMSVAESPGALAADDAGLRWADIQRRADDLAQTLYSLREAAPDPAVQARIDDTLASLQAARSAMGAERVPGADPRQAEVVRGRLETFEWSLQALRGDNQRYP